MDYEQFEKNINKKFQDFNPEPNADKIWASIEDQLPAKKKNRKGLFFLIFTGCLILSVAAIALFGNQMNKSESEISEKIQDNKLNDIKILNQNIRSSKPVLENAKPNVSSSVLLGNSDSKTKEDVTKSIQKISNENTGSIEQSTSNLKDDILNNVSSITNPNNGTNLSSIKESNDLNKEITFTTGKESSTTAEEATNEIKGLDVTTTAEFSNEINPLELLTSINSRIIVDDIPYQIDQQVHDNPKKLITSKKKNIGSFLLTTNFGASLSTVNYLAISENDIALKDLRESIEKQLETLHFGIGVDYKFAKNFHFHTGLNITSIQESTINDSEISESVVFENVQTGIIYDRNNETQVVIEDVTADKIHFTTTKRFNSRKFVTIPLMIFYDKKIKDKFSFDVGAGVDIGIFGSQPVYESWLNNQESTPTTTGAYEHNNRLTSLLFASNFNWNIGDKFIASVGLQSKIGLNGVYNNAPEFNKYYNTYGLNFGVKYKL